MPEISLLIVLAVLLLPYLLAPLYRTGHPASALMAWRYLKGAPVSRQWVDLAAMAAPLPRSVVASEDAKFCSHRGVDWGALREVIDDAEDGEASRGGSTITQQVAKNLFLWPGRSVVRKALELPLALWIDFVLPKRGFWRSISISPSLDPAASSARRPAASMLSAMAPRMLTPREAALTGGDPAQSACRAAPVTPGPACAVSPEFTWPGARPPNCSAAGVKIELSERFLPILNLALDAAILYKRGLIGIFSLRSRRLSRPFRDDATFGIET